MIALDLSPSMNAADRFPSRLARARECSICCASQRRTRPALLAYGAEPFVVAPLTTDVATIAAQVPSLDTSLLPVRAKAHRSRPRQCRRSAASGRCTGWPVILVTDGLDHADARSGRQGAWLPTAIVFVLGVGTDRGGPVAGPDGGLLKDEQV